MEDFELKLTGILCSTVIAIIGITGVVHYLDGKFETQQFQACVQETKNVDKCELILVSK